MKHHSDLRVIYGGKSNQKAASALNFEKNLSEGCIFSLKTVEGYCIDMVFSSKYPKPYGFIENTEKQKGIVHFPLSFSKHHNEFPHILNKVTDELIKLNSH